MRGCGVRTASRLLWRSMKAFIMPLSATPGRMIELAAVSISKLSTRSFFSRLRMPGDSM